MADEAIRQGLNARQAMLRKKGAFGTGSYPVFPTQEEIRNFMGHHQIGDPLEVYGDGSLTTPKMWWAALGGYGVWFPKWPTTPGLGLEMYSGAIGQASSSTRQELCAWIQAMTQPVMIRFATDSVLC